ncbi:FecR domain-containing protein [Lentisphaera profundi]|uniref:FecR domain-containing protein n=1 Tax=Lentisphaera profundi TaxID=1658616 RepID=A0ABY7W119_9BACT|nr:LamG-like jellyroll fold domain-containing protein [Lentisphaera profundi]WDE98817.1 FecR domain-containing protein [Lentisphaera profundi]
MDKRDKLIASYCDGLISDKESIELEQILADSADARQKLIEYINIDAGLKEIADAENDIIAFPQSKVKKKANKWIYAAAALFIINLALVFQPSENQEVLLEENNIPELTEEKTLDFKHNAVAKITKMINVDFGKDIQKTKALNPGLITLKSGILQIEFFSGATMVLEGPAEINVKSAMEVACLSGKMHVKVPETAQGFIVDTGNMQVHDLGTEFAIDMNSPSPEVHVLDGEVEIHHDNKKLKTLLKDDSISWDNQNQLLSEIASRDDFISYRQIGNLKEDHFQARQAEWQSHIEELKNRNDLVLLYDFRKENDWQRSLQNQASHGEMEGAIIGAQWSEGRWKGKSSLDFKSINDRIRLHIPGQYDAMTMTCWVKIDSFDRWLSSLLLTDGFKAGALHWQLSDSGEMILGAKHSANRSGNYYDSAYNVFSPQVIKLDAMGEWAHLAMVYDSKNQAIRQYLNGALIDSGEIIKSQTIKLGNSEIANWSNNPKNNKDIRSFNGRMDEFIIFSSALASEEIKNLYESGKP